MFRYAHLGLGVLSSFRSGCRTLLAIVGRRKAAFIDITAGHPLPEVQSTTVLCEADETITAVAWAAFDGKSRTLPFLLKKAGCVGKCLS